MTVQDSVALYPCLEKFGFSPANDLRFLKLSKDFLVKSQILMHLGVHVFVDEEYGHHLVSRNMADPIVRRSDLWQSIGSDHHVEVRIEEHEHSEDCFRCSCNYGIKITVVDILDGTTLIAKNAAVLELILEYFHVSGRLEIKEAKT